MNTPTFIITMPNRKERLIKHLQEVGIDAHIFPAFDGKKLGVQTEYAYLEDHPLDYWQDHKPCKISAGDLALCLSAFAIIKMSLALGYQEVLICEDDVVLVADFNAKFAQIKRELPSDWGMVYLGWCCLDDNRKGAIVSPNLIEGKPLCTHAVLFSRKAMELISEKSQLWSHIDIYYHYKIMPHLKCYVAYPETLATQLSISGEIPSEIERGEE